MTVGDKMVLTLNSREFGVTGNEFANVFAYEVTAGTGNTADLNTQWRSDILPDLLLVIHQSTEFYQLNTYNMDNPADFNLLSFIELGLVNGERMPYFVAWEFRYVRSVRGINDGRKAFGIVGETNVDNGAANSVALSQLGIIQSLLYDPLVGATGTYTPRIWRRAGNYAPFSGTPRVGTPYPDTFYSISDVRYQRVSTQNTRKR